VLAQSVHPGIVLMDAGYGADTDLRGGITAPGLTYSAANGCPKLHQNAWRTASSTVPVRPRPPSAGLSDLV
jgi:hypothetical protein